MIELNGTASFRDSSKVEVKGKHKVKFLRKNEKLGMVEDVYYTPEVRATFLVWVNE
jgi:uncharacterized protein YrrD